MFYSCQDFLNTTYIRKMFLKKFSVFLDYLYFPSDLQALDFYLISVPMQAVCYP